MFHVRFGYHSRNPLREVRFTAREGETGAGSETGYATTLTRCAGSKSGDERASSFAGDGLSTRARTRGDGSRARSVSEGSDPSVPRRIRLSRDHLRRGRAHRRRCAGHRRRHGPQREVRYGGSQEAVWFVTARDGNSQADRGSFGRAHRGSVGTVHNRDAHPESKLPALARASLRRSKRGCARLSSRRYERRLACIVRHLRAGDGLHAAAVAPRVDVGCAAGASSLR